MVEENIDNVRIQMWKRVEHHTKILIASRRDYLADQVRWHVKIPVQMQIASQGWGQIMHQVLDDLKW